MYGKISIIQSEKFNIMVNKIHVLTSDNSQDCKGQLSYPGDLVSLHHKYRYIVFFAMSKFTISFRYYTWFMPWMMVKLSDLWEIGDIGGDTG